MFANSLPARLSVCRQAGTQADRSAGKQDGRLVGVRAGLQASVCMSARLCIHENPHADRLAGIHTDITTLLLSHPSIPFLLLGSLGIGNRCFESRNNNTFQIRLLTDFLCSQKHSKVSFELLEGFSVTAEKWQQQGMFRVTRNLPGYSRKPCRRVASPKSGNLFLTCGVLGLFLVLYTVQSYLVVQCGTPYAEQCCRQCAVALCLFQRMDDLFLLHVVQSQRSVIRYRHFIEF